MQSVAVGWQLYALTGSAFDLGLVGLAQFAPTVLLTLIVGQVADRYDRRGVVIICHLVEGGATAALAVGTLAGWLARDGILAILVVIGGARAFENPARASLLPRLVPLASLSRAIASMLPRVSQPPTVPSASIAVAAPSTTWQITTTMRRS